LVGASPELLAAVELARKAAGSDADILIEAESGTGKELLARLIHAESARRTHPFIAINCSAMPDSLLESELFGHVKGAFTGASNARAGRFEAAENGTLLLDEIGELPLALQPKLLRVLQERQFERLGDNRPTSANVRVIATTNRSLLESVQEGNFRLDLYYRLNVIPLTLPPLRERGADVVTLAEHFLSRYAPEKSLSTAFIKGLERHSWPGNVRELSNLMRRAAALCTSAEIGPEYLNFAAAARNNDNLNAGTSLRDAERKLLEATLAATSGNRTRAAEMLGVSLRTVRNKIRNYGLPPRSFA
jgi:transcriptional regulator with PAS, ATPase and Fis domain